MEVYLIRHGETGGNVAHRHQAEHTSLTDKGKQQALEAAKRVKEFRPTHLLTSPLVRSVQTASIIGEYLDIIPETNEHFIELVRPPHMYGHYHKSIQSLWFYSMWYLGKTNTGESYEAVRKRINLAKSVFAGYPEDARIAVVSHSVFINLFLAHMCDDAHMNPVHAVKIFSGILKMKNTEVIPLIFNPNTEGNTCGWIQS